MATSKRQPVKEHKEKNNEPGNDIPLKYEEEHFIDSEKPVWNYSLFTGEDITNFKNGTFLSKIWQPSVSGIEYKRFLFCCMGTQCHQSFCYWRI
jgi:hypothetical protein